LLGTAALHSSLRRLQIGTDFGGRPDSGRLLQTAFYLAAFAAAAIAFAVTLNWRNDRLGFWANGVMVGIADIPFILFVLIPGYAPWWPGLLGPILWVAAFFLTALGRVGSTHPLMMAPDSGAQKT
jgi:hypothetical protein